MTGLCDDAFNDTGDRSFPHECCQKHAKYDKRVPGLFKTEYEGEEMIGLCSKTYIVSKTTFSKANSVLMTVLWKAQKQGRKRQTISLKKVEFKFSSKGMSKRLVKTPLGIFKNVLRTRKPESGLKKGYRVRNNGIYTYSQSRCCFSYFYCKRQVLQDGFHTVPLRITLFRQKASSPKTMCNLMTRI